jgi:HD-GYP domain-containing protein (c-di-GMP phosphodiesterase class II)
MTEQSKLTTEGSQKRRNLLGEKFIVTLYRLVAAIKIYQSNNAVFIDCAREFIGIVSNWVLEDGYLNIHHLRGHFFLQDEKLVFQRENINIVKEMSGYFEQRMITGLRFDRSISEASIENIREFLRLLDSSKAEEDPVDWLVNKLEDNAFSWVEIVSASVTSAQGYNEASKEIALKSYSYALASLKEVSQKIVSDSRAGVHKIKRIVQDMVDLLSIDDALLLGMSTVRDYDDYTYTHSVNVAILSLCLGKSIGLSRLSLSWLGVCGLVHDLGKVEVPKEILNKPGKLTADEFIEMEKHPLKSVRQILKLQAERDLKAKILLPPLEHHMKYDSSGYPRVRRKQAISLFGRIITIADVFDALTSLRIYRPVAYSPDKVLGIMLEGSGRDFDPILLKVFINMLGAYPMGTLVELDTGEKGLVLPSTGEGNRVRPKVVLLVSDSQGGYKKGKKIDLAEKDTSTGSFVKNIVNSFNPSVYGIQPAEFIL